MILKKLIISLFIFQTLAASFISPRSLAGTDSQQNQEIKKSEYLTEASDRDKPCEDYECCFDRHRSLDELESCNYEIYHHNVDKSHKLQSAFKWGASLTSILHVLFTVGVSASNPELQMCASPSLRLMTVAAALGWVTETVSYGLALYASEYIRSKRKEFKQQSEIKVADGKAASFSQIEALEAMEKYYNLILISEIMKTSALGIEVISLGLGFLVSINDVVTCPKVSENKYDWPNLLNIQSAHAGSSENFTVPSTVIQEWVAHTIEGIAIIIEIFEHQIVHKLAHTPFAAKMKLIESKLTIAYVRVAAIGITLTFTALYLTYTVNGMKETIANVNVLRNQINVLKNNLCNQKDIELNSNEGDVECKDKIKEGQSSYFKKKENGIKNLFDIDLFNNAYASIAPSDKNKMFCINQQGTLDFDCKCKKNSCFNLRKTLEGKDIGHLTKYPDVQIVLNQMDEMFNGKRSLDQLDYDKVKSASHVIYDSILRNEKNIDKRLKDLKVQDGFSKKSISEKLKDFSKGLSQEDMEKYESLFDKESTIDSLSSLPPAQHLLAKLAGSNSNSKLEATTSLDKNILATMTKMLIAPDAKVEKKDYALKENPVNIAVEKEIESNNDTYSFDSINSNQSDSIFNIISIRYLKSKDQLGK